MNIFEKFTELIEIDNPKFEYAGKVCDWRNYVPYDWQVNWNDFSEREKRIIAVMAEMQADKECFE